MCQDLHHLLLRVPDPSVIDVTGIIDASFLTGFLDMGETDVDLLAKESDASVIDIISALWHRLDTRAKRFYGKYYLPMVKAYAVNEAKPVRVIVEGIPRHLHVVYGINGSKTGRMVARGSPAGDKLCFNVHMVPKRNRGSMVVAEPGKAFIHVDYVGAEIRTIAAASCDPVLCRVLAAGMDPYLLVAEKSGIKIGRKEAKNVVIGVMYGAGIRTLADDIGLEMADARQVVAAVQSLYKGAVRFIDDLAGNAVADGVVKTPTGRVFKCPDPERARQTIPNWYFQSLTADANNLTYARLVTCCGNCRPLIHIHDGYVLETDNQCAEDEVETVRHVVEENPLSDFGVNLDLECKIQISDRWLGD
jgi:DNA polymerase I-like protein with 3'-5' exonuclease and polymerase domains